MGPTRPRPLWRISLAGRFGDGPVVERLPPTRAPSALLRGKRDGQVRPRTRRLLGPARAASGSLIAIATTFDRAPRTRTRGGVAGALRTWALAHLTMKIAVSTTARGPKATSAPTNESARTSAKRSPTGLHRRKRRRSEGRAPASSHSTVPSRQRHHKRAFEQLVERCRASWSRQRSFASSVQNARHCGPGTAPMQPMQAGGRTAHAFQYPQQRPRTSRS